MSDDAMHGTSANRQAWLARSAEQPQPQHIVDHSRPHPLDSGYSFRGTMAEQQKEALVQQAEAAKEQAARLFDAGYASTGGPSLMLAQQQDATAVTYEELARASAEYNEVVEDTLEYKTAFHLAMGGACQGGHSESGEDDKGIDEDDVDEGADTDESLEYQLLCTDLRLGHSRCAKWSCTSSW
jgi:hypothetical protein